MRFLAAFHWLQQMILRMTALALFAAMPVSALTAAAFGPTPLTPGLHATLASVDTDHGHSHEGDEAQTPSLGHGHDHNPADHAHEGAARLALIECAEPPYRATGIPARITRAAPGPGFPLERPPRG